MARTAKWAGTCPLCAREIYPGDPVDGWIPRWGHADCVRTEIAADARRKQARGHKPSTYRVGKSPASYGGRRH